MKCPQTFQIEIKAEGELQLAGAECVKEECAWWDSAYNACIEFSKARLLDGILADLNHIAKKMPYPPAPKH